MPHVTEEAKSGTWWEGGYDVKTTRTTQKEWQACNKRVNEMAFEKMVFTLWQGGWGARLHNAGRVQHLSGWIYSRQRQGHKSDAATGAADWTSTVQQRHVAQTGPTNKHRTCKLTLSTYWSEELLCWVQSFSQLHNLVIVSITQPLKALL